jgi:hypothetical protein
MEGVEEWSEVGIDLGLEVSGEEAEAFAGFDGGAGEDDAFGHAVLEEGGGGGDGEVGFSGPGGAGAEDEVVGVDGLEVAALAWGFGFDDASAGVDVDFVDGAFAELVGGLGDGIADVFEGEPILSAELALHVIEDGGGFADRVVFAGEVEVIISADEVDAEGFADHLEMPVGGTEEGELLIGLFQRDTKVHDR